VPMAAAAVRLKDCSASELLAHLPTVQRLLGRLMACVPEGASAANPVILVSEAVARCLFALPDCSGAAAVGARSVTASRITSPAVAQAGRGCDAAG
jgi:hypothetical protein